MTGSLVKMMGYPQIGPNDANSYTNPQSNCASYLHNTVNPGPTTWKWMRVFLNWSFVQPDPPPYSNSDVEGAFQFYNTNATAKTYFDWLDNVVHACNVDNIFVDLCLSQYYPGWTSPGSPASEPDTSPPKPVGQRLPSDVSTSSYWARWVTYIYNRYYANNFQGVFNSVGPSAATGYHGNPKSAWIGAFEFCNEPNYYSWVGHDATHCVVANMFQTVDSILSFWGPACGVLGPGTSDVPEQYYPNGIRLTRDGVGFTNDVLSLLQNWHPVNYVAWSHHNYRDMLATANSAPPAPATLTRVSGVASALSNKNWRGGGDRNIWVTEGGYKLQNYGSTEVNRQITAMSKTWPAYKGNANTVTFPQYLLNNVINDSFPTGLTTAGSFVNNQFVPGSNLTSHGTFANLT